MLIKAFLLAVLVIVLSACSNSPASATNTAQTPTQPIVATTSATQSAESTVPPLPSTEPTSSSNNIWSEAEGMPIPWRSEMPVVLIDGYIYVAGGFDGLDVLERYDPATDTWEALASMPEGRHHNMAAAYDGQLYAFGGSISPLNFIASNSVWRYDPASNAWSALDPMPEARMSGVAVTLGDKIYIVGGSNAFESLLEFTPDNGDWRVLDAPTAPRDHTNAVGFNSELWVIGGRGAGREAHEVEIFDPISETWRDGPALNQARAGFAAGVIGQRIIVAGGELIFTGSPGQNNTLDSVEIYDPVQDAWQVAPPLPNRMHGFNGAVDERGRFITIGGSSVAGTIVHQGHVQIYTP